MNAEVVKVALRHAWDTFGRKANMRLTISFSLFLVSYCFNLYAFEALVDAGYNKWMYVMSALFLVQLMHYARFLTRRIWRRVQHEAAIVCVPVSFGFAWGHVKTFFLGSLWNTHDWVTLSFMVAGTVQRLLKGNETVGSRCAYSISSFLVFFKSLYYLRPLPAAGPMGKLAACDPSSHPFTFSLALTHLTLSNVHSFFPRLYQWR
jgi:hypothetical protein